MRYRPIYERFSEKYEIDTKTGCWNWTATKVTGGYGMLGPDLRTSNYQQNILAHRFSYEHHIGPVSDGKIVCHECDNPSCVNPSHLFLSTNKGNMADMKKKGRARVMTREQVHLSLSLLRQGYSQTWVARNFSVNRSTLQRALQHAAKGDYGPGTAKQLAVKYVRVTDDDKAAIRSLLADGATVSDVARRFNIDRKHVRTIRDKKT